MNLQITPFDSGLLVTNGPAMNLTHNAKLRHRVGRLCQLALLVLFFCNAAECSLFGIDASGSVLVGAFGGSQTQDLESNNPNVSYFTQPLVSLTASYDYPPLGGEFTAAASAEFTVTPSLVVGTAAASSDQPIAQEGSASGSGYFSVQVVDTIYVGGLAAGSPVDILVTDTLHSVISFEGYSSSDVPTGNQGSATGMLHLVCSNDVELTLSNSVQNPTLGEQQATAIADAQSGGTCTLEYQFLLVAEASSYATGAPMSVLVDASDTGAYNLDVLTPGADYTTASGATYTSTPEPATVFLGGFALLSLIAFPAAKLLKKVLQNYTTYSVTPGSRFRRKRRSLFPA